jgi:hypothetical protein
VPHPLSAACIRLVVAVAYHLFPWVVVYPLVEEVVYRHYLLVVQVAFCNLPGEWWMPVQQPEHWQK